MRNPSGGYTSSLNSLSQGFFGYPINSPSGGGLSGDRAFALDNGQGRYGGLVMYAPGSIGGITGRIDVFNNSGGNITNVF